MKILQYGLLLMFPFYSHGISQFWYADSFNINSSNGEMIDINTALIPMTILVPKGVTVTLVGCSPEQSSPILSGQASGLVLNRKVTLTNSVTKKIFYGEIASASYGIGWINNKYVIYGNHSSVSSWPETCDKGRVSRTQGVYSITSNVQISLPPELPAGEYIVETGKGSAGFIANTGGDWNPAEGTAIVSMLGGRGAGTSSKITIPQRTSCEINNSQSIQIAYGVVKMGQNNRKTESLIIKCTGKADAKVSVYSTDKLSNRINLLPGKAYADLTFDSGLSQVSFSFDDAGGQKSFRLISDLHVPYDTEVGEVIGSGIIELNLE
ncbi:hypothetical protein KHA76_003644 [Salmonella enterica subsp. houtenae serovar 44:z36,[z38]:-]|uniref:Fimbrial protein n=1 Tax=Salmonella enterica subsp. houtenae serovar 44:z36[z38]:- TaxID=1967609 RepID=A0A736I7P3_SALHO|nr:hypothetical protein [Salmonella enterica subsp. houtenae]EEC1176495.1 hypothetical protein [Salmonella enterica]EHM8759217.1 hypothetical protein [Salmonella enterica subsp. houtenae serovar 44:z36,[z38]:-]HAE7581349.1 hypothetical protein [Salmonella enterica subsp. houtenae serovar 44:z36[z38]:-]HCM6269234.1 hypothetical protein [Salmonella enterica subsp. houtenae serovar 44:z36,Z38:-]